MTVLELIQKLQELDMPNARVVTPGFDESNLEDVDSVHPIKVCFHDEKELSHNGRHELSPLACEIASAGADNAVFINF